MILYYWVSRIKQIHPDFFLSLDKYIFSPCGEIEFIPFPLDISYTSTFSSVMLDTSFSKWAQNVPVLHCSLHYTMYIFFTVDFKYTVSIMLAEYTFFLVDI